MPTLNPNQALLDISGQASRAIGRCAITDKDLANCGHTQNPVRSSTGRRMKIDTLIAHRDARELNSKRKPEHVKVIFDASGNLQALHWLFETTDKGLKKKAKQCGGRWNRDVGGWVFPDTTLAQGFLDAIINEHPDWPIIDHPGRPFLPLAGIGISCMALGGGLAACLVPLPLPYFARLGNGRPQIFRVGNKKEEIGLLLGNEDDIAATLDLLITQGATCDDRLATTWPLAADSSKLKVRVSGWAVQVECSLSNPLHYLLSPQQKYRWEGAWPNGIRITIPWTGTIHTTRKLWPTLQTKIAAAGLAWEGDDPALELTVPAAFDYSRVAGWNDPAPNGHLLHAYQKEGAKFCASRGMRALIGDEMGVGKTVQAIAAAEAVSAPRIFVICPANARYVWDREIQGWGGRGAIQHITSQLDRLDTAARWHILTYDLLVVKAETWRLNDPHEEKAFIEAFPELARAIEKKSGSGYPCKVSLSKPLDRSPAFADPKRVAAWNKLMQRLGGQLLNQILSIGQMLVILDEAHRAKNKTAKRTKVIRRIAAGDTQLLMLTGTPLRNNEHEAAVLLGLIDAEASVTLSKEKGYGIQDVKDYLGHFMIRRTKAEVLPELPEKTRQRIDISDLDIEQMGDYHKALEWAYESYFFALKNGKTEAEARKAMQGGIELARTALGLAKIRGGEIADLVIDVVENKGCCVVFCAHHQASDDLKAQLEQERLRVAIVDGRVPQKQRAEIVKDFQKGRLDVFIGGINSAGEAITLTRADTVIFVELDWVPAALLQAEDRIHRVGQQSNCHVIQLIARTGGNNLDEMMVDLIGSKIARIGAVLGENTTNIIAGSIQYELHNRLLAKANQTVQHARPQGVAASVLAEESARVDGASGQKPTGSFVGRALPEPQVGQKTIQATAVSDGEKPKPKRGRPKVYVGKDPLTATERSKRSIQALAATGGKRIMLRLTPEAHEALRVIMDLTGGAQETATINQVLVARKQELLNASTQ